MPQLRASNAADFHGAPFVPKGRGRGFTGETRGRGRGAPLPIDGRWEEDKEVCVGEAPTLAHKVDLVFLGRNGGKLVPYGGAPKDVESKSNMMYRLYPAKTPAAAERSAAVAVEQQLPAEALEEVLRPGMLWQTLIGSQLVCVTQEECHSAEFEALLATSELEGKQVVEAVNGSYQTSFAPQKHSNVAEVIEFLRRYIQVVSIEVIHVLHVTEITSRRNKLLTYEHIASSRDAVMNTRCFAAAGVPDVQPSADVVVLPCLSPQNSNENYVLFRCRVTQSDKQVAHPRLLQMMPVNNGWSAVFLGYAASPMRARYEERHVVKIEGSTAEVWVVMREELNSDTAPERGFVTVELRQVVQPGDRSQSCRQWLDFVQLSETLCRRLAQFATVRAPCNSAVVTPPAYREGDAAAAPRSHPCLRPCCAHQNRHVMCLADAWKGCSNVHCTYWHGFTEVQQLLAAWKADCLLDQSNFQAVRVEPRLTGRLRAALSLQLLRIREAASIQLLCSDARQRLTAEALLAAQRLTELVKQYNAVAHCSQISGISDVAFFYRCCRRLEAPLPLLAARDELRDACLRGKQNLLVDSSTGSGKSTQLPQYLAEFAAEQLEHDRLRDAVSTRQKLVICVEPRALAAVSLAEHVSREYDDPEMEASSRVQSLTFADESLLVTSHIVYTTELSLLALLRDHDMDLGKDVYAVVLDEAHERSIAGDMLLGILKAEMQRTNFAFRLVVCSATLQVSAFERYLPGTQHISVKSCAYPVEILYAARHDKVKPESNYVQETVNAVVSILNDPPSIGKANGILTSGKEHILAFLPAAANVQTASNMLKSYVREQLRQSAEARVGEGGKNQQRWESVCVCTISGRQNVWEQRGAFAKLKAGQQKVIFATSVAETSVTIDGVGYVVDCGLSRIPRYDPTRHLTEMVVSPITQSSAVQRAGRAGRTGPGVCIRLYTKTCFDVFEKDKPPAIKTSPLHMVTLQLAQMRHSMLHFDWIDKPDRKAIKATLDELIFHGAFGSMNSVALEDDKDAPPILGPFGEFLLDLEGVSVPLGRLLYDAKNSGNNRLLALAALTAATIERFHCLYYYPPQTECKFFRQLRELGEKYKASSRGDVLCAVQIVAAALHDKTQSASGSVPAIAAPELTFLNPFVLKEICRSQRKLFCSTVMPGRRRSSAAAAEVAVPAVSPALVEEYADTMQRLLTRCFCLQVAVRCNKKEARYETLGAASQYCRLADKSFMKQQHLLVDNDEESERRKVALQFDPRGLPDVCVFCSLLFHSPSQLGTISLCTPVNVEYLPFAVQAEVEQALGRQLVAQTVSLPSLLNGWSPQEMSRWLSRKLNGASCKVAVDYTVQKLSLVCARDTVENAFRILSQAIDRACQRHAQTCHEVALSGFCRVTWTAGCMKGEVLRDKDEYVTLQFTGPCEASITCLELDLPAMVEEWSQQWFGRTMAVTVRSGSGGASPASGSWTALVTFANSKDAHDFYGGFVKADGAQRPFVMMEPHCEQEPLAPAFDSTLPMCRIYLRFYFGHADPENGSLSTKGADHFPMERIAEFSRHVRAALPDGVVAQSQRVDQTQQLLCMELFATSERAADAALAVLHRIRGSSMHYRSLFFDVAYSVEFPLPAVANKSLQRLLQTRVQEIGKEAGGAVQGSVRCSTLHTHGSRSLLVKCTSPALLQRAQTFLLTSSAVHGFSLRGANKVQQVNEARALAFRIRDVVKRFNALGRSPSGCVFECQFQLREADGKLCFIGPKSTFERVRQFVDKTPCFCKVKGTTLTLPPRIEAAKQCSAWVAAMVARCRSTRQLIRAFREGNTFVVLAPPNVVQQTKSDPKVASLWRAIDGEENKRYDPELGEIHRRCAVSDEVAEDEDEEAGNECSLCFCELQADNIRLLCGHRFCTECLAGAFNTEGGAVPEPPITCARCQKPISADELSLYAPVLGLRRLGELTRTHLVEDVDGKCSELKECPNKACLGVPKVVTYANRRCSGCDLAYCEVCVANGEVRSWHEGRHYSPSDILADKLIGQLPLLPKCPRCGEPFYNFDGCFAVSCSRGHGFCGFCMQDCGNNAHEHVRTCERNPSRGSYYANESVFFRCRSEDLAAKMKEVLVRHPAGSPRLVETLCDKVKKLMSDDWPKGPVKAAEAELMARNWGGAPQAMATAGTAKKQQDTIQTLDDTSRAIKASAAEAAAQLASEFGSSAVNGVSVVSDDQSEVDHLRAALASIRDMCIVDLSDFVEDAVHDTENVEEAAVLLYAFYDVDSRIETALRSLGTSGQQLPEVAAFLRILLRGLQLLRVSGGAVAERTVCLNDAQLALYNVGGLIVWDAPTRCFPAGEEQAGLRRKAKNSVTFVIQCNVYSRLCFFHNKDVVRYVLPAGARLRITKVDQRAVHLQQESDFLIKAPPSP